jgi:hypothetical protein
VRSASRSSPAMFAAAPCFNPFQALQKPDIFICKNPTNNKVDGFAVRY